MTLDQAAASAAMHSFIIEGAKLLRQITLLCKYLKHAGPQKVELTNIEEGLSSILFIVTDLHTNCTVRVYLHLNRVNCHSDIS